MSNAYVLVINYLALLTWMLRYTFVRTSQPKVCTFWAIVSILRHTNVETKGREVRCFKLYDFLAGRPKWYVFSMN